MATQRCSSINSLRSWRSPVAWRRRKRDSTVSSSVADVASASPAPESGIGVVGPLLVHAHTDLAMVGTKIVIVGDDREDLTAQREAIRLERDRAGGLRAADH